MEWRNSSRSRRCASAPQAGSSRAGLGQQRILARHLQVDAALEAARFVGLVEFVRIERAADRPHRPVQLLREHAAHIGGGMEHQVAAERRATGCPRPAAGAPCRCRCRPPRRSMPAASNRGRRRRDSGCRSRRRLRPRSPAPRNGCAARRRWRSRAANRSGRSRISRRWRSRAGTGRSDCRRRARPRATVLMAASTGHQCQPSRIEACAAVGAHAAQRQRRHAARFLRRIGGIARQAPRRRTPRR